MSILSSTLRNVTTITIARAEKKNALTVAMYEALSAAVEQAAADAGYVPWSSPANPESSLPAMILRISCCDRPVQTRRCSVS